jgi:hypothetical protein
MMEIRENDFMAGILQQLYRNRDNHEDSALRDINFMYQIVVEQVGQLGKALADQNDARGIIEVFHVAAILFEVFIRLKGENDENGNQNLASGDDARSKSGGDSETDKTETP